MVPEAAAPTPRMCDLRGCPREAVQELPLGEDPNKPGELTPAPWVCLECWQEIMCARARKDFNVFAEMVCTDDETGQPIRQAPIHKRWAELCNEYDNLLIWAHIRSGKTTQLSILRTVWELGNDPTLRFAILSNVSSIATKIVKAIASYIKNNAAVKSIFPDLVPDPEGPWTTTELQVVRKNNAKDPSVRAVGVHGALTSARVDRLIVDDILDLENTDTEANRAKVELWYQSAAVGRLSRRAKVLIVGTAFHPSDLLHKISKQRGFRWFRFPIFDPEGNVAWPEHWPQSEITNKREALGPAEFARQLLCEARDDNEARFKQTWIDAAVAKGEGLKLIHKITDLFPDGLPEGFAVFTGVDLGVKVSKRADETIFFTFLEDNKGNRRLLCIEGGKLTAPEIIAAVVDQHRRYGSLIVIENNAAQDFMRQFIVELHNIPIVPHTTTAAKRDPILGVEGLAIELANGKWIFPSEHRVCHPQVAKFINEMLYYAPTLHPGDRLMACYFARNKAREVMGVKTSRGASMRIIGEGASENGIRADGRGVLEKLFAIVGKDKPEEAAKPTGSLYGPGTELPSAPVNSHVVLNSPDEPEPEQPEPAPEAPAPSEKTGLRRLFDVGVEPEEDDGLADEKAALRDARGR